MAKAKERAVEQHVTRTAFTRTVTQVEQTCPICKEKFWGARIRTYCSKACKNKADYERHAEQRRADRREYHRQQKT
jgi:hypothetical protein